MGLIVATTMSLAAVAYADERVALVIGNSAYRTAPQLLNPRNDAEDVGRSLAALGFATIVAVDLDRAGMNDALERFSRRTKGAEIALVYYAGHGMQFAGRNYLLPVDARLDGPEDVNRFSVTPLDDVLEVVQSAAGARIVILDACRNNPVEQNLKRRTATVPGAGRDAALTRGLTRMSAGDGLIVVYATQANEVASDGAGRNSPFTSVLLRHVVTPDLDLRHMLLRVQDDVVRETRGRQRPELFNSLVGEFKLKPSSSPQTAPLVSSVPPPDASMTAGHQATGEAGEPLQSAASCTHSPTAIRVVVTRRKRNLKESDIPRLQDALGCQDFEVRYGEKPGRLPNEVIDTLGYSDDLDFRRVLRLIQVLENMSVRVRFVCNHVSGDNIPPGTIWLVTTPGWAPPVDLGRLKRATTREHFESVLEERRCDW